MKNSDKPINPIYYPNNNGLYHDALQSDTENYITQTRPLFGLTKREYTAIKAMQGILSGSDMDTGQIHCGQVAKTAIQIADELLKQLEE